mgnify:CR=1 FL=1
MNKQQEPRLRFKGFTGAWEEKTLNDVSEVFEYGLNAQAVNFDGVHKYIRITDIDDESRQFLQENVTSPDVDFSKADNYKLQKGDLLFARTGASVGKSYLYNENDGLVYFAGFLIRAKLNKEVDDQFIFQNTLTNHFNRFVTLTSQRSGQPGINSKEYSEFEFLAPSLPEQTHLGLFFRRLDSQIAESRAVLEKSRQLKKAMLAKMFPANGEKTPKIRFKGFEGEWECRKFSEVAELRRGLTYSPLDISPNGIRVLRSSNIDEENYIEKNDDVFVCERAVNIPLVQNGDILITAANGSSRLVGKHAIIQTSMPAVHGGFMLLAKTENPYFLNASMSSTWYLDFIRIFVAGGNGAIGNLSIGDLNEQEILIPKTLEEQTAIGNFFRQLDETIALQSAEVEKLNQLKKGLLAAMLV